MKLIIQIPCFNEESSLPKTLAELPRFVHELCAEASGLVSEIEWLVIDDGSSDRTSEVARACGVHHVLRLSSHQGLAQAFASGIHYGLKQGAAWIVTTDADNQYRACDISALLLPVLEGRADLVIGARDFRTMGISSWKVLLHRLGARVVRQVSGTDIPDATSGFRAMSRKFASQIRIHGSYTYTLETIIQAGRSGARVKWVPIRTNRPERPSRLIRNTGVYVVRQAWVIVSSYWRHPWPRREVRGRFENSRSASGH